MYLKISLVIILILSSGNGEKATSYVSVSKGKEGGYSYEVIHDYPTKDSSASVHVFGNDDFSDKPPDVSYDYGAKIAADVGYDYGAKIAAEVAKITADAAPRPEQKSPARGRGKKQRPFADVSYHRNPVNDINSYGVIKHAATATGNVKPAGQVHSSTYVNIKHNTRAQTSGASHLKSQGVTSYSYDIGNHGNAKDNAYYGNHGNTKHNAYYGNHGNAASNDAKSNHPDSGGGPQASASGPGFSFSDLNTVRGSASGSGPADYGPVSGPIIYHHHHYHGEAAKDEFDAPDEGKGFDFGKGYFGKPKTKDELHFRHNDHSYGKAPANLNAGHVGSISIEATLGHTCSTGEVTPLPHFHPRKPDDGFFNYAQDYGYGVGVGVGSNNQPSDFNGYDYPAPLQNFHAGNSANSPHSGGKKGKWKPVIITSSKSKGKLHTFRISRDFKPGQLVGGFKPSFGPPGHHHKTAGHLRSISHDAAGSLFGSHNAGYSEDHSVGHNDPFADFHDAPYFDYDGILSSLENGHHSSDGSSAQGDFPRGGSSFEQFPREVSSFEQFPREVSSFEEFPDYAEGAGKSLKDYHNSLFPSKPNYRRSKKIVPKSPLSSNPIVVPPLKTTTVHSATTVTSPIPGVGVTSFLDSPSPLALHAPDVSSRNYPLNSESDQATSYANPNNLSLRRNTKRKNG